MSGHVLCVQWQGVGQRSGRASGVASRTRKVKGFFARILRVAFEKFRLGKNTSWAAHRLSIRNLIPPRPTSQPAGGQGKDVLQLDQVLGLLRTLGIDADLMEHIQRRIEVKTKASEKPLSEIVAELEAKERRACNHSIHLQRIVDSKREQLAQAETRLQAHLEEHDQIKEQLAKAQAKQFRHLSGNPYDPDEVYQSSCEIQEDSGGEEEEEEDDELEMEDITTEEMFADVPHEDYVQNSSSLPAEGKGGPPPPTVVGGVQFCDKADKAKVKKASLKKKPASSKDLCG